MGRFSKPKGFWQCLIDPDYAKTTLRVALIADPILFVINHGTALWQGRMTQALWLDCCAISSPTWSLGSGLLLKTSRHLLIQLIEYPFTVFSRLVKQIEVCRIANIGRRATGIYNQLPLIPTRWRVGWEHLASVTQRLSCDNLPPNGR
ncbi:hypothetical protein Lepto7375DRAFT_5552 [Leptolyngbya sp. PCC 7375]|nr:hypothetical protein Lepto7375DRAFT_5552 [Leptolyngbya sp. PCC 7375]